MATGNPITALEEIKKEISEIRSGLLGANSEILAISKAAREVQGNFANIKLPKELESSLRGNKVLSDQLSAQVKERERLEKSLQTAIAKRTNVESDVNREIVKNREETRILNKALRDESVLSSKLVGEYRKLEIRHARAAKTVRNLSAANKENTREYRAAITQLRKYESQLKKADTATNNFRRNVGNYSSAIDKFRFAYRQFAGVFGISIGIQIARDIFEQVKALDALEQALLAVTKTQKNYNEAQEFLSHISSSYGIELKALTKNYTSYLAALQGTTRTAQ